MSVSAIQDSAVGTSRSYCRGHGAEQLVVINGPIATSFDTIELSKHGYLQFSLI